MLSVSVRQSADKNKYSVNSDLNEMIKDKLLFISITKSNQKKFYP